MLKAKTFNEHVRNVSISSLIEIGVLGSIQFYLLRAGAPKSEFRH